METNKFRAWDTVRKKMFSAEEMGRDQLTLMPDGQGFINVSSTSTKLSHFLPHLLPLQFIGLRDKTGREIYNADILLVNALRVSSSYSTWYQTTNKHHGPYEVKAVVYWQGAGWKLKPADPQKIADLEKPMGDEKTDQHVHFPTDFYDRGTIDICEVIGNLYENPELAEENKK